MNKAAGLPLIRVNVSKPAAPAPTSALKKTSDKKKKKKVVDDDDPECAVPCYQQSPKLYGIYSRESVAEIKQHEKVWGKVESKVKFRPSDDTPKIGKNKAEKIDKIVKKSADKLATV